MSQDNPETVEEVAAELESLDIAPNDDLPAAPEEEPQPSNGDMYVRGRDPTPCLPAYRTRSYPPPNEASAAHSPSIAEVPKMRKRLFPPKSSRPCGRWIMLFGTRCATPRTGPWVRDRVSGTELATCREYGLCSHGTSCSCSLGGWLALQTCAAQCVCPQCVSVVMAPPLSHPAVLQLETDVSWFVVENQEPQFIFTGEMSSYQVRRRMVWPEQGLFLSGTG